MNKLFSRFFKRNNNTLEPVKSRFAEGWKAYEEAKELFFTTDKNLRDDKKALDLFDKAIECNINDAYADRAFCLQCLNYHYDAIEDFNKAITLSKGDANLYFGRGSSKQEIAAFDDSISDFKKAVELSQVTNSRNSNYNETIREKGWDSAFQLYSTFLKLAIDTKESLENRYIKEIHEQRAKEVIRR